MCMQLRGCMFASIYGLTPALFLINVLLTRLIRFRLAMHEATQTLQTLTLEKMVAQAARQR